MRMLSQHERYDIMSLKRNGFNHSQIARKLSLSRTTVIKYVKDYERLNKQLLESEQGSVEYHETMQKLLQPPESKAKFQPRTKRKYSKEIDQRINEILDDEKRKDKTYGAFHKLARSAKTIYEMLKEEGFDIGYTTVCNAVREKRKKAREAFIKQEYDYGDRGEFDFGERTVTVAGKLTKVYIAAICLPRSNKRVFFVYDNQKKEVFIDSHVKCFEQLQGVPRMMVYDNMRNVVKRFVGQNQRELTDTVLALAYYYGFDVVLAAPARGNEKGSVENSVKVIMKDLFSQRDVFESWDDLLCYCEQKKEKIEANEEFEIEREYLNPTKKPFEAAIITENKVNKYSFVRVLNNDYSVPEAFVGATVTVKTYPNSIEIFYRGELIAQHQRLHGTEELRVDLKHYLKTLLRKPGALRHSVALKQAPKLKKIYEDYYIKEPKKFLEILFDNKDTKDIDQLCQLLLEGRYVQEENTTVHKESLSQLDSLKSLFNGGGILTR